MLIISFKYKMMMPRMIIPSARLLNLINKIHEAEIEIYPFSFVLSISIPLKTTFRLHKARVRPTGSGTTFAVVFALINWLREFPLSAVTNCFEMRCQLKQLLLLYYEGCPCSRRQMVIHFRQMAIHSLFFMLVP